MKLTFIIACLFLSCCTVSAASLLGIEPPADLLVSRNGYQWAWASPCAPSDGCDDGVSLHHGFSVATESDWLRDFSSPEDVYAAFLGGSMCSSAYFSKTYDHCDGGDAAAGHVWNAPWGNAIAGTADTFVLRSAGAAEVPEPSTYALLATGLLAVGLRRKLS